MTSVPKPLKFLRPHYDELAQIQQSWPDHASEGVFETAKHAVESAAHAVGLGKEKDQSTTSNISDKALFADILSVLAMTYSDSGKRETLKYRLKGGSEEDPGVWGHEYVRCGLKVLALAPRDLSS